MHFTDIFIRRPVLASVVSLLILVLGLRAYSVLPILQYPRTENAIVTVTTIYYGARRTRSHAGEIDRLICSARRDFVMRPSCARMRRMARS